LLQDGFKEMKRIQDYLGLENSDERLYQILQRCSLNNLKADIDKKIVTCQLVDEKGKSVLYRKGN